jgi:hypothetical protein
MNNTTKALADVVRTLRAAGIYNVMVRHGGNHDVIDFVNTHGRYCRVVYSRGTHRRDWRERLNSEANLRRQLRMQAGEGNGGRHA